MTRMIHWFSIGLLFLGAGLPGGQSVVLAAELSDFVREDVGLCLHVREIPAWIGELEHSEIRKRLESTSFFQRWKASRDFSALQATIRELERAIEHPLAEGLRSTLGLESLLAVYVSPGERPAGVLMTRPANREQAQSLIDLWNLLEGAEVTPMDDQSLRRTSPQGPELYYLLVDDLFALSDRKELIAELAKLGPAGFEKSLARSDRWKRALASLEQSNWATAFFQPDRWQQHLPFEHRDSFEEALFREVGRAESLVAGADGRNGFHVRFNLLYPPRGEPEKLRQYRERHAENPTDWSGFSSQTILMAVGRGGPEYLAEFLQHEAPKSLELQAGLEVLRGLLLGLDPLQEVLPQVGRQWQFSITSQPERTLFPWDLQLQLDLEDLSHRDSTKPDLHSSLRNLARTLVRIGGLLLSEPLARRVELFSATLPGAATIDGFESVLGLSPTIGISRRQLVLSSSRGLAERELTVPAERDEVPGLSERLAPLADKCHLGIQLDLKALRGSLSAHSDAYLRLQKLPEDQQPNAIRRLEQLSETISLFDGAYLFGVVSEDEVSVHLGVETLPARNPSTPSDD